MAQSILSRNVLVCVVSCISLGISGERSQHYQGVTEVQVSSSTLLQQATVRGSSIQCATICTQIGRCRGYGFSKSNTIHNCLLLHSLNILGNPNGLNFAFKKKVFPMQHLSSTLGSDQIFQNDQFTLASTTDIQYINATMREKLKSSTSEISTRISTRVTDQLNPEENTSTQLSPDTAMDFNEIKITRQQFSESQDTTQHFSESQETTQQFSELQDTTQKFSELQHTTQPFSEVQDATQHFSELQDSTQKFSELQGTTQKFSELQDTTQKFSELQDTTQKLSELQDTTQQFSELQDTTQPFSELQDTTQKFSELQDTTQKLSELQDTTQQLNELQDTTQKLSELQDTTQQLSESQDTTQKLSELQDTTEHSMDTRVTTEQLFQPQSTTDKTEDIQDMTKAFRDVTDIKDHSEVELHDTTVKGQQDISEDTTQMKDNFHTTSSNEGDVVVAPDGLIRLVMVEGHGWEEYAGVAGRVEVFYNQTWGTVCDNYFSSGDLRVICKHYGYSDGEILTPAGMYVEDNRQGTGQIWLDNLKCSGSETTLHECDHKGWGNHNCDHSEDVAVACY